jgi:hypothetical protein
LAEEVQIPKVSKKRIHSKARGNVHMLPQQLKKIKTERLPLPALSCSEILLKINSLAYCCTAGGKNGCFVQYFTNKQSGIVDYNLAIECYSSCRSLTRLKSHEELDKFVQEKFRESIQETKIILNGKKQFVMQYMLRSDFNVCKKAFSSAFGISVKKLERCSTALKLSETNRVHSIETKTYKDDTIHKFSYKETEELIKLNLGTSFVGNVY